jgi:hypothetical protein
VTRERIVAGLWEALTDELRRSFGRSREPSGADATSSALRFHTGLANALGHISEFDTAAQCLVDSRRRMLQSNLQTYIDQARNEYAAFERRRRKQEQDYKEAQDRHAKAMRELKVCAENFVPGCSAYYASHPDVSLDDGAVAKMRPLFAEANRHGIFLPSPESLIEDRTTEIKICLRKTLPSNKDFPLTDLEEIILSVVSPGQVVPILQRNKASSSFNVRRSSDTSKSSKLVGWRFPVPEGFSDSCKLQFELRYGVWGERADVSVDDVVKTGISSVGSWLTFKKDYIIKTLSTSQLSFDREVRVSNLPGKPGVTLCFSTRLAKRPFWKASSSCEAATATPISLTNSVYDFAEALSCPHLKSVPKPGYEYFTGQKPEETQEQINAQIEKQFREDQQNLEAAELSKLLEVLKCRCGVVRDGVDAFCKALDVSASQDARSLLQVCRCIATWSICGV